MLVLEASIAKLKSSTEPVSILRKPIYLPSKRFIPTKSCVEGENDEFCKKSLDDQKCSDQEEFKMDQILSSNLTKKSELSTATGMTSEKISIFEKFNPKDETDDFCQTTRDINHTMALIYGSLNNVGEYLRITRSARQFKEGEFFKVRL